MLGVLLLLCSSLQAQDPAEELKLFIKAQQAKMDEQSKVLEQQKILILEQSKLLKQQKQSKTLPPYSTNALALSTPPAH